MASITISAKLETAELASQLTDIINEAYHYGEEGMWKDGFTRTTTEAVAKLLREQKLMVARDGKEILGCIKVIPEYKKCRFDGRPARVGEVGMLAVTASSRRHGLGRQLMETALAYVKENGCDIVELQLVKPVTWIHPIKAFLALWYKKLGFQLVGQEDAHEEFQRIGQLLKCQVMVEIYECSLC